MLTQAGRKIYNAVYNSQRGQPPQPRWKLCLRYVNGKNINDPGIMSHAIASMYAKNQNHFKEDAKKSVTEMVEVIR